MSLPAAGITPDGIRWWIPPYHLSQDLLQAALATLPRLSPVMA